MDLTKWDNEFEKYIHHLKFAISNKNTDDKFDSSLTSSDISVITYLFLYFLVNKIAETLPEEDLQDLHGTLYQVDKKIAPFERLCYPMARS